MAENPWAHPREVDPITARVGALDVKGLLPERSEIPQEIQNINNPWNCLATDWFYHGLPEGTLRARPGIDQTRALAHCSAVLQSFAPGHLRKLAGVGYLLSLWFFPPSNRADDR